MTKRRRLRTFRIEDHPVSVGFVLIDDTDVIVRVSDKVSILSGLAFDLGADEVTHAYHYAGVHS